jgi:hypothetical protein
MNGLKIAGRFVGSSVGIVAAAIFGGLFISKAGDSICDAGEWAKSKYKKEDEEEDEDEVAE